ncbi:hypothetical protein RRG08_039582 [Elysia crispata]|uniref:Uncharacterized protein n=1 Tax=Elysia crispata TaxID=231223 RepID=A0AAE1E7K7_9GAST|nr:hypothetical protein RRG08_039582 [Elysia crispata]
MLKKLTNGSNQSLGQKFSFYSSATTKMFGSNTNTLVLLFLLATSVQFSHAQLIPPFVCGIFKFSARILTGCPNPSILCFFLRIGFDILCSPDEPTSSTPLDVAFYKGE